jgi:hypothetical protein
VPSAHLIACRRQPRQGDRGDVKKFCVARHSMRSALHLPDGTDNTAQSQLFPHIAPDGTLLLPAGEKITVGFDKVGDTLSPPVLLKVADASGPVDIGMAPAADMTLTFRLSGRMRAGQAQS